MSKITSMSPALIAEVNAEMRAGATAFEQLDQTNTADDFVLYSIAYVGRSISNVGRNQTEGYSTSSQRRAMIAKAIGLLARAYEIS